MLAYLISLDYTEVLVIAVASPLLFGGQLTATGMCRVTRFMKSGA